VFYRAYFTLNNLKEFFNFLYNDNSLNNMTTIINNSAGLSASFLFVGSTKIIVTKIC